MNTILQGVVREAMSRATYLVSATQTINDVARLFHEQHINSAPVIDEAGRCIGIITSSDLVRYQSQIDDVNARIDHGMSFDLSQTTRDGPLELVSRPFDQVQRHMSTGVQSIAPDRRLAEAATIMTQQHIHHLVVLDESDKPVGILSSLDLLTKLIEVSP